MKAIELISIQKEYALRVLKKLIHLLVTSVWAFLLPFDNWNVDCRLTSEGPCTSDFEMMKIVGSFTRKSCGEQWATFRTFGTNWKNLESFLDIWGSHKGLPSLFISGDWRVIIKSSTLFSVFNHHINMKHRTEILSAFYFHFNYLLLRIILLPT